MAKLLKTAGLSAIQPWSYQPRATERQHRLGYNQNLLASRAAASGINEVWVGDITYPVGHEIIERPVGYLALVMDLCSWIIVGWE